MECRQWIVLIEELDPFLEGDCLESHEEQQAEEGRGVQGSFVNLRLTWWGGVAYDDFVRCDDGSIRLPLVLKVFRR